MNETKLEQQIETYQELAKENKNIDVGALMLSALKNEKENVVSAKSKKWAYMISLGAPPLGLFFALKYWYGDEDDAKQTAYICIALTVVSILIFWWTTKIILSGSGSSVQQIEQIKPSDIYQLSQ